MCFGRLIEKADTNMKRITIRVPEPYVKALDELTDEKRIPNRAEGIRIAIRDFLKGEGKI